MAGGLSILVGHPWIIQSPILPTLIGRRKNGQVSIIAGVQYARWVQPGYKAARTDQARFWRVLKTHLESACRQRRTLEASGSLSPHFHHPTPPLCLMREYLRPSLYKWLSKGTLRIGLCPWVRVKGHQDTSPYPCLRRGARVHIYLVKNSLSTPERTCGCCWVAEWGLFRSGLPGLFWMVLCRGRPTLHTCNL